jgi:hypothetical protein
MDSNAETGGSMDRTNTSMLLKRYFNRGISILVPDFGED